MTTGSYSFIDIVVLDEVRQRFAAGEALVLLTDDLETVIWANGPGAALIGNPDIMTAVGTNSGLALPARRQIMGSAGFHAVGRSSQALVRIGGQAVTLTVSRLVLPGGEAGILLSAGHEGVKDHIAAAQRAITGFVEPDQYLALIDQDGAIVAATEGFGGLHISRETLAQLTAEVRQARDRLVKKLVPREANSLPAGIARLTDTPALNLLVVVDEPVDTPPLDVPEAAISEIVATSEGAAVDTLAAPAQTSPDLSETQPVAAPAPEKARPAVRFLWRTDADGRFNTISDEFLEAAGIADTAIVGKTFRELASELNFDADGEISGLLERRDTWSGRTVTWPIADGLHVPVDLAALPAYNRDRSFEGFRGFGVARFADAAPVQKTPETAAPPAQPDATQQLPDTVLNDDSEWEDAPVEDDEFYGEVPVLAMSSAPPAPPPADKVIHLSDRRQNERGLSPVERNAFREIGERLRAYEPARPEETPPTFGKRKPEDRPAATDDETLVPPEDGAAHEEPAAEPTSLQDNIAPVEAVATAQDDRTSDPAGDENRVDATVEEADDLTPAPESAVETGPSRGEPSSEPIATADEEAQASEASTGVADEQSAKQTDQTNTPQDILIADATDDAETGQSVSVEDASLASPADAAEAGSSDDDDLRDLKLLDREPAAIASPEAAIISSDPTAVAPPEPTTESGQVEALVAEDGQLDAVAIADAIANETAILDKLPVPVLIHAGDDLHYANAEFLSLTGYASLDALGEAGGLDALFADTLENDEETNGRSLRLRRRDGVEFPIEALLRSVKWQARSALMLVVRMAGEGDEEETPALAEARTRMAELRTIIDTATDGVVIIDRDSSIRSISRPAEALFGFDNDDLVGKPFTSLFAIESQKVARDYLAGLADHGVASVLNDGREVIGRESQGRFIPLFMTIGRMPNDSGYCAVLRDVTQWKRAEEELSQSRIQAEHASSQKTDFLARVSHEIRTPLNAIIGFSELMLDEKFGPVSNDRYRDYLRDINRSGNHVLDLVNDLLDISKIEAGEQEMAYEAISLNEALAEAVAIMQPQANRERVIIRSSFASKLPPVVADLRSVRQIALNILSNAVRFTQAGGQVIISTAHEQSGDIVLRVRDTGIGMSQAEIEQALKPFKQINALKRPRGDGTGLGLPLTKAMVEANRARFVLTSAPGEGTLVEVVFPSTRVLAQ